MSFSIVKSLSGIVILVYTVGWLPGRWDNITVAVQITIWTCIKDPWLQWHCQGGACGFIYTQPHTIAPLTLQV